MEDQSELSRVTDRVLDVTEPTNQSDACTSRDHLVNRISGAVKRGDCACVEGILSSAGPAAAAVVRETGSRLLMDAISGGHVDVAMTLINNGVDVTRARHSHTTCLHEAVKTGDLHLSRLILTAGVPVNVKDRYGNTALMFAASEGLPDLIRLLVEHGAVVNQRANSGDTPLYLALERDHLDAIRILLSLGARCDVRIPARSGNTLLHLAAKKDDPAILTTMLKASPASVRHRNRAGYTPFDLSLTYGSPECIRAFLDHSSPELNRTLCGWTPLMYAARRRIPDVVRTLIGRGANVNLCTSREGTALHEAVTARSPEVVRILLASGAQVNTVVAGKGDVTALHLAALLRTTPTAHEIILDLLRAGADVRARDAEGRDPSRLALTDFLLPTVILLQHAGTNPDGIRTQVDRCYANLDTLVGFLCGHEFRETTSYNPAMIEENVCYLHRITHNPKSLSSICLVYIRNCLQGNIHVKSRDLPLPDSLKDEVNFGDLERMKPMFSANEN